MPRFPYLSMIFLLLGVLVASVIVPNNVPLLPPVEEIEADLSARFAAAVEIEGPVRLRFVPRPQLIISDAKFTDTQRGEARFAATIPQLVVNLDVVELVQRRFVAAAVTLLNADVNLQLAERPAALLTAMHGQPLPPVGLLDSNLRITGLDPLRPKVETRIDAVSMTLAAQRGDGPMRITMRKTLPSGQSASLQVSVGRRALATKIDVSLGLGVNEQLTFAGFVTGSEADWRLDGEVSLMSDDFLMAAMEARLPLRVLPEARRFQLSGLVSGSSIGLRADSLEISALNTVFRTRLALDWPRQPGETPFLDGRLTTGAVNLDLLRPSTDAPEPALLARIWQGFAPDLAAALEVEATRFTIGGETGTDLSAAIRQEAAVLSIDRLNLNLPFNTALLASGAYERRALDDAPNAPDGEAATPRFTGNFSARSSDTLALLLWLGSQYDTDFSAFAEGVDEAALQRTSLVGDVVFDGAGLALNGLAGRIGNDYLSADITLPNLPNLQADMALQVNRFDLADWGIVESGAPGRDSSTASVWPQLNRLLGVLMGAADPQRVLDFKLDVGRLFAGARALGPFAAQGRVADQQLRLDNLRLTDFNGADIALNGAMNYDAAPSYGGLTISVKSDNANWLHGPVMSRFAPLDFNPSLASDIVTNITITAPDAAEWPKVIYNAKGDVGGLVANFAMTTPARSLAFVEAGTNITLSLTGAANDLAQAFFLPSVYDAAARGDMRLQLAAQSNDLFSVDADMGLAQDALSLNGTLRAATGGKLLSGAVAFNMADFLPLLAPQTDWQKVAASGEAQLNAAPGNIGFSGLEVRLGGGQISGEGVLQTGDGLPRLNMNLAGRGVDVGFVLPQRDENGWRTTPMNWSVLGRTNADIQFSAAELRLGDIDIDTLAGRLKLTEGVLEAPDLTAELMGGQMKADVLAEGGSLPPRFGLSAEFDRLNPNIFLLKQYGNRLVDAGFFGTLNLEGRGTTPRAMMASLTGILNYEVAPGNLTFFDAVGFGDSLSAPSFDGDADALVGDFVGMEELAFARGLGLAQMRDGVVEKASVDFVFAEGLNEARLEAAFDVVDLVMDAEMTLYPIDRQRPIIWRLTGDLTAPKVESDASPFNSGAFNSGAANSGGASSATQPPAE